MLQIDCLGLHLALLRHKSFLLDLKVLNNIFKIADRFVEEVASVVLMSDLLLQLVQSLVQVVSLRIFLPNFCLEISHFSLAVFLKLLLVFLELNELVVEHLNLFLLRSQHIFVVALQSEIVHLGVTLIAHPM